MICAGTCHSSVECYRHIYVAHSFFSKQFISLIITVSCPWLEVYLLSCLRDRFLARRQKYLKEIFILSHQLILGFAQV